MKTVRWKNRLSLHETVSRTKVYPATIIKRRSRQCTNPYLLIFPVSEKFDNRIFCRDWQLVFKITLAINVERPWMSLPAKLLLLTCAFANYPTISFRSIYNFTSLIDWEISHVIQLCNSIFDYNHTMSNKNIKNPPKNTCTCIYFTKGRLKAKG